MWGAVSSLTQVTVPPTRMVTFAGPNFEPFIETVAVAGATVRSAVFPAFVLAGAFFTTFVFAVPALVVVALVVATVVAAVAATVAAAAALAATTTVPVMFEWKSQT